jgi:AcrR family transcriptional regulator
MLTARGRKPKPPTARDRQRQETERRLLAAARKLFSDYGYQNPINRLAAALPERRSLYADP